MPSTFAHWLCMQTRRDDPVGDLARDYSQDRIPQVRPSSVDGLRRRMQDLGAVPEAMRALEDAAMEWEEWREAKFASKPTRRA